MRRKVNKFVWKCPYYVKWVNMLERSLSARFKLINPAYTDVILCEEWLTFSSFRSWCVDYENKFGVSVTDTYLDKDIINEGDKVYSPDTCCLVSRDVNNVVQRPTKGGLFPLGVYQDKRDIRIYAQCGGHINTKRHLGTFKTIQEAHRAWQKAKVDHIESLAAIQKDDRVARGLRRVSGKIEKDILLERETISIN